MEAVKGIFQTALDVMDGQIHVLVNCAGIQRRAPALQFSEQDWDDVSVALFSSFRFDTTLSLFLCTAAPFTPSFYFHRRMTSSTMLYLCLIEKSSGVLCLLGILGCGF